MVLTEENFARHEYPLSHHGAIYDSYPSNFIKDYSHWSFKGHGAFGGSMNNLMMSSLVKKG